MAFSIHVVVCNFFDAVVFALPIAMNDVSGVVMDVKMVATRLHVDPSNVPTIGEVLLSRSQSDTEEPVLIDLHLWEYVFGKVLTVLSSVELVVDAAIAMLWVQEAFD